MEFHPRSTQSELFELLDRLQSARLDDQRCELPSSGKRMLSSQSDSRQNSSKQMLQRILKHPPPYPMIAVPPNGGYWLEVPAESKRLHKRLWISKDECDKTTKAYADKFKGHEHQNY